MISMWDGSIIQLDKLEFDEGGDYMKKKLIVCILVLILVLSLMACGKAETNNSEPITSETKSIYSYSYGGKITNITDTLITLDVIFYGGPQREVPFAINEHTIGLSSDLAVGDYVVIETNIQYMADMTEPVPAVLITKDTESK